MAPQPSAIYPALLTRQTLLSVKEFRLFFTPCSEGTINEHIKTFLSFPGLCT